MDMVWERIYFNETKSTIIEIEKSHLVNEEFSMTINMLKVITSILILLLATPALYKICRPKITFINFLVILDCLNSVGHLPILLHSFQYVAKIPYH